LRWSATSLAVLRVGRIAVRPLVSLVTLDPPTSTGLFLDIQVVYDIIAA
jgi:hypothetical protein